MQTITVRLKLMPDAETKARLLTLLRDVNECANWIGAEAWTAQIFRRFDLHHLTYYRAREVYGLGADTTCGAIAKVAAAYNLAKRNRVTFRDVGAIPIHRSDYRLTSDSVRLLRTAIPYRCRPEYEALVMSGSGAQLGVARSGDLFLSLAVEIETPEPQASDVIGVDLGIVNIATDSNGVRYSGAALRGIRYRRRALRAKLQKKGTRSAKRRLKRMRRRDSLHSRDINHCISKRLVAEAEHTKVAIALEELKGISRRVRVSRKKQRAELTSWSFSQLRLFIEYKAALAGVPVVFVDPRNTSRQCSRCGHTSKKNRPDQATFSCGACGLKAHADINAATNIRERGRALISAPYVTGEVTHLVASPFLDN